MKKIKHNAFFTIIPLLLIVGVLMNIKIESSTTKSMKVIFPLKHLQHNDGLIVPLRIQTSYEASLFENLSSSLIKEDSREDTGFAPDLALSWNQPNNSVWVFHMRKNLKWSDGSNMSLEEIRQTLFKACGDENRLVALKRVKQIKVGDKNNTLTFIFAEPVGKEILHELSLYEALIYKDIPGITKWSITSGPYSMDIEASPDPKRHIKLKVNPFHHNFSSEIISEVFIDEIGPLENYAKVFSEMQGDYVIRPPSVIVESNKKLDISAPVSYRGAENVTHFLKFNGDNELAQNEMIRREIATLFKLAVAQIDLPKGLRSDDQMIPVGYFSRLPSYEFTPVNISLLKGKTVTLNYPVFYEEFTSFKNKLVEVGERSGVKFEFTSTLSGDFVDSKSIVSIEASEFNKNVPYESWNYLLNRTHSAAYKFRSGFESLLSAANYQTDTKKQNVMFQDIHRRLLDGYFLVPLYSEGNIIYTSDRIKLTNVKNFDLRSRFYDARINEKT